MALAVPASPAVPGVNRPQFWSKVDRQSEEGCWIWTGALTRGGYGQYSPARRRNARAHRFAYEQLVGPVPIGLELDHLCGNRACVNPRHLEPVTHAENLRRGRNHWRELTHCVHGHPFDGTNTYRYPDGSRGCRTCTHGYQAAYRSRKAAA